MIVGVTEVYPEGIIPPELLDADEQASAHANLQGLISQVDDRFGFGREGLELLRISSAASNVARIITLYKPSMIIINLEDPGGSPPDPEEELAHVYMAVDDPRAMALRYNVARPFLPGEDFDTPRSQAELYATRMRIAARQLLQTPDVEAGADQPRSSIHPVNRMEVERLATWLAPSMPIKTIP